MKGWSNSDVSDEFRNSVPEKRLLAAVLQRAVTDFVSGEGELKNCAKSWLMDDDFIDVPLTFKFVCEALDLDVNNLRRAIFAQAQSPSDSMLKEVAY